MKFFFFLFVIGEAKAVMTFGYSAKRRDPAMIGQYGNGLKS